MNLDDVKRSLEARLETLTGRLDLIDAELRTPGASDSQDRASETENREVLEKLSQSEREEVRDIRTALARMREGTYADCARCGRKIPLQRLEALPYTTSCVSCAG